jgi:hypothetical protein
LKFENQNEHYWKAGIKMSSDLRKPSANPADARRTQRVHLQIPIQVRAQFAGDSPISEDTTTLEVNAHGGLIALAMRVRPGQKLVLRNWATAKEQDCRVVHVRDKPIGKNEVGIAFPFAIPKFWNIEFPPPDWTPYLE